MPSRDRKRDIVFSLAVTVGVIAALWTARKKPPEVNTHDPAADRVTAFDIRSGEIAVAVRVCRGDEPAPGAVVWAEPYDDDSDGPEPPVRRGEADAAGLVRVPVHKGGIGSTTLFARDADGRVGGGAVHPDMVLSAPDVVLADVAPMTGRLVGTDGHPIGRATLTPIWFSADQPPTDGRAARIDVPKPARDELAVTTAADGRFTLPAVPVGYGCEVRFRTDGYREGKLFFPSGFAGECQLAPAGRARVHVMGDGTGSAVNELWCILRPTDRIVRTGNKVAVNGYRSRRHDGTDTFVIPNVVPGEYDVEIEGTAQNAILPAGVVRVTIDSRGTADATIPLRRAGRLVGRVVATGTADGVAEVKVDLDALHTNRTGYSGRVTTDSKGQFAAFVPADVSVRAYPVRCPAGYAVSTAMRFGPDSQPPVTVGSGQTVTIADFTADRLGVVEGIVVADGRPIPEAAVEVRWADHHTHRPVTVTTDSAGRFQVGDAPRGQPVAIRVRAGELVNATVVYKESELSGPVTIAVSAGNAFRARGRVTDASGKPISRAKVVVSATITPEPQADPDRPALNEHAFVFYAPAEIEALFTDSDGRFQTGPLWPGCEYTAIVTSNGLVPQTLPRTRGIAGQIHEFQPTALSGASSALGGVVVGLDGRPVAGAEVINSGDGPSRIVAITDAAGRFTVTGLYDGSAVLVAHKPGYRWAYAVARPGEAEAKIVLRSQDEPPATIAPPSEADRQAEAELMRRLSAIAEPAVPEPFGPQPDYWAEARKDLDAYLKKTATVPGASHTLTALARELAKDDRAKALRVLRAAADAAKQTTPPGGAAALVAEYQTMMRVMELIRVAESAESLKMADEAKVWLTEGEAMIGQLPAAQQDQPRVELAAAWVLLDPTRTERMLKARGGDGYIADMGVCRVLDRLLPRNPTAAVPWLARFRESGGAQADPYRGRVAIALASKDLAQAVQIAEGIRGPVYRGGTLAKLATVAHPTDTRLAHTLMGKAIEAVAAAPDATAHDSAYRSGVAVYLVWQAEAVGYPDRASVVAVAMASRAAIPAGVHTAASRRSETMRLVVGLAGLDSAAARALLSTVRKVFDADGDRVEGLIALALADPAAAVRALDPAQDADTASEVLAALKRRSALADRLDYLSGLWWLLDARDPLVGDDGP